MIFLIHLLICVIIILLPLLSFKKKKESFIYLNINYKDIPLEIIDNEDKLFNYICNNINIQSFKYQFNNLVSQYDLIIVNKTIYDRSLHIPSGEIFKYIFNLESCKMLLKEGIFCEIHFLNKKIPINVLLSK